MCVCVCAVPPQILFVSSVKDSYGNEPEILTVNFLSSYESDTTVTWLLNTEPLPISSRAVISTQYTNRSAGSTSLQYTQVTRADEGQYSVLVESRMMLIPIDRRRVWFCCLSIDVHGE